jgi:hypothetical protein
MSGRRVAIKGYLSIYFTDVFGAYREGAWRRVSRSRKSA